MTTRPEASSTDEGVTMNSDTQRDDSSMSPENALAARLEALESRIAYQEHWLDTLDQAVAGQERRLAQLERINALMQEKLRDQQQALQEAEMASPSTCPSRRATPSRSTPTRGRAPTRRSSGSAHSGRSSEMAAPSPQDEVPPHY